MEVLSYEKDSILIPFIATKSKDNTLEFSEDKSMIYSIPDKPVIEVIKTVKEYISKHGFVDMGGLFILDIITDSDGWPGMAKVLPVDMYDIENPYVGFTIEYNKESMELLSITGISIGDMG